MSARGLVAAVALALAGCAPATPTGQPTEAAPATATGEINEISERCEPSGKVTGRFVYQESDRITAYFEVANVAEYRSAIPGPFAMPERPLCRVSVIDFYEMVQGPTYRESEISIRVDYRGEPGWLVLTMPVTDGDSCWGGRRAWGFPKVVRRVTLERFPDRYVGTSYAPGGRVPELRLTLEPGRTTLRAEAREVLGAVSTMPDLTLRDGQVLRFGGRRTPIYDLERLQPSVYAVRTGQARLEFPRAPESLLDRLGVGRPLAAYWLRQRVRFSIQAR